MADNFIPVKKATTPVFQGQVSKEMPIAEGDFIPVMRAETASKIPPTIGERIFRGAVRPTLETGGMIAGGVLGAGAGAPSGPGAILSGVAGGTLGYGIGRHVADVIEESAGIKKPPEDLGGRLKETGRNLIEGAELEMGGKFIGKGAALAGKGAKQALGKLTGTGEAAIESAVEATPAFKAALRGKTTPQEIVGHAQEALSILKNNRGAAYRTQLAQISQNQKPIDMTPIRKELSRLMDQYNVKLTPKGEIDISRIKMGKTGRNDIAELIDDVQKWGTKAGDDTVLGLDTLKSQIDDFYSDSSQARQFVASLRNVVDKTIKQAEPRYGQMTKGYSEATKLIKDIESNLMLRKEGMSGRIVADQTLRRLTSAMKDNFELRRDLVEALGNKAAMDLKSEIAGTSMKSFMPSGISGTGLALTNMAIASFINPKFLPVIAASSPRISAEFLMMFGKGLKQSKGMSEAMSRWLSYELARQEEPKPIRGKQVGNLVLPE